MNSCCMTSWLSVQMRKGVPFCRKPKSKPFQAPASLEALLSSWVRLVERRWIPQFQLGSSHVLVPWNFQTFIQQSNEKVLKETVWMRLLWMLAL